MLKHHSGLCFPRMTIRVHTYTCAHTHTHTHVQVHTHSPGLGDLALCLWNLHVGTGLWKHIKILKCPASLGWVTRDLAPRSHWEEKCMESRKPAPLGNVCPLARSQRHQQRPWRDRGRGSWPDVIPSSPPRRWRSAPWRTPSRPCS